MSNKLTQSLTECVSVDTTNDRVPIFSATDPSELKCVKPSVLAPTIADASETVKGKIELATASETVLGTDTVRAITPSALTSKMDTDGGLTGNSDSFLPSQKAVKTYGDRAVISTLTRIPLYAPQGFLINGKIVVTDAAGITVALKTLAGTDPSATDPVYCRIGDTVYTISAALSVAKADGTNYLNAGSAELATKEIDYFVYLIPVTGGVGIGFARIPSATKYDGFAASETDEKGRLFNNLAGVGADTAVEVIGRFAATLSAGAGYTWSVPTYTAINLIQRPIYETRFLTAVGVYSGNGSMTYGTVTTSIYDYKITNNEILVIHNHNGTVGGTLNTQIRFVLPFSAIGNNLTENQSIIGNNQKGYVYRKIDTSTKNLCVDESPSGNYTAGSSFHFGTISYKI